MPSKNSHTPGCAILFRNHTKKWHLELHTHPWAGHDLTVDDGAWVALQLQDWVVKRMNA
jgi:hypothetical protein